MNPSNALRRMLVERVRDTFNDRANGERPVQRSMNSLLPPQSVAWRVHGDVISMMVGGIAALLVEMLHPQALGGVWDHSKVDTDMAGRLRRTARFIAVTTFGQHEEALAAIERVRRIHAQVQGVLPDGTSYRADDPSLLAWIHVAGSLCFLDAWRRYGEPGMSAPDQDRYFAEVAVIASALGANPVPGTRIEAEQLAHSFRPQLCADKRTMRFRQLVLDAPANSIVEVPLQRLLMTAAIDLMPDYAREMHGLRGVVIGQPAIRAATLGVAGTLRWAFGGAVR
ncbi:MAG: oxygenase MpaB family protein [Sphingomicrobium sp.]|nr:DUF2236 domain-containing protein [Sphingomonadales bacterium]